MICQTLDEVCTLYKYRMNCHRSALWTQRFIIMLFPLIAVCRPTTSLWMIACFLILLFQFAAILDDDFLLCFPFGLASYFFHFPYDFHTFNDVSEDNVFVIQPLRFFRAQEELAPIGIRSGYNCRTRVEIWGWGIKIEKNT